jgi:hypothetical protein
MRILLYTMLPVVVAIVVFSTHALSKTNTCAHKYTCTHTHVYTYTHIHTHTHVYTGATGILEAYRSLI